MEDRISSLATPHERSPLTGYQKKLFFLLGVATFFEGYEYVALSQLLPSLREAFALSEGQAGILISVIGASSLPAYVLIRRADRVGRKPMLAITVAGYTLTSILCALAQDAWQFGAAQFLARAFLFAEYALCMVYIAEEFPADRRGFAAGVMQGLASLGSIVCAGVVPLLLRTPLGFRAVYLVGAVPLLMMTWLRRQVRETERFAQLREVERSSPFAIFRTAYRGRVLLLALINGLTLICTYLAVTYWKEFALQERGFDHSMAARALMIAALGSLPLVFFTGRLLDAVGRRLGALIVLGTASTAVLTAFNAHAFWLLTLGLTGSIYGASAVLPVLNTLTLELFPTEMRADAYGWSYNLLGKLGYVVGPLAVGFGAERWGYGPVISAITLLPWLAIALIFARVPETRGRELEDTAAL
ncbi:MAG TPA: MFS transporter [Polyangiales bacterium]|nr:MFS transporter [Polyangiales bacterium]